MKSRAELESMARRIRLGIAQMTHQSGLKGAHLGGSMSVADILAVLYGDVMHYDTKNPLSPERDRVILSKAHAAVALYAALHEAGFLTDEEISHAMQGDSPFFEHPRMDPAHGIEFSGGSLGQGLSLGMGTAPVAEVYKKAVQMGIPMVVESETCNPDGMTEAKICIEYLRSLE